MNKFLCIIPARGGSKGLPGKNIKLINGLPLIAHTIKIALACPSINKVIVSTDDKQIARIAKEHNASVPFMRPTRLALDNSPTIECVRYTVKELNKISKQDTYTHVIILEPTSPLRTIQDVEQGIKLSNSPDVDTVVSVTKSDIDFSDIVTEINDGFVKPFLNTDKLTFRRQDNPITYKLNGALFIMTIKVLFDPRTIIFSPYGQNDYLKTKIVKMPIERSVNINNSFDFSLAEMLMIEQEVRNDR